MKNLVCCLFIALLFASCANYEYTQTVNVKSDDTPKEGDYYTYKNDDCKIVYNFWDQNGNAGFIFVNNTDNIIYIDRDNSFFIQNNLSTKYYKPIQLTSSNRVVETNSVSSVMLRNASTGYNATRYGQWLSGYRGSESLMGILSYSNGLTTTSSVSYESSKGKIFTEEKILSVAPRSYVIVSDFSIASIPFQDCSVPMRVKTHKHAEMTYSKDNTPMIFSNYITYKVGKDGEEKHVQNKFYITGFINDQLWDVKKILKEGCKNQVTRYVNRRENPSSFYIRYTSRTPNTYSADCKKLSDW